MIDYVAVLSFLPYYYTVSKLVRFLRHSVDCLKIASPAIFEILGSKRIGVTSLTSGSHCCHRSLIPYRPFSIGGSLEPSIYLYDNFQDIQRRM